MSRTPDPIDHLLALPPAEFVSARNKLAGELKKIDGARAAEIKALPKPSPSVWALDRVARQEPDRIAAFLEASDALEEAQSSTGGSEEGRRAYQSALATQRESLDGLVSAARGALAEAHLPTNRAVLERVTNNLRWAVLDDEHRRLLEAGRLLRDLEPPDFGALVGRIPVAGQLQKPPPRLKLVPATPATTAKERAAQKRMETLRARQADAKEEVTAAREELRRTKAALDEAERAVTAQRRELAAVEKKAADARRAHEAAETALDRRNAEVESLAEELAQAREE
jgi:hypothetical protein